jgi:hypothetical protein
VTTTETTTQDDEITTQPDYSTWTTYRLLLEAKRRVGAIGKGGQFIDRQGKKVYDFRGIDDVVNTVSPIFADLGILGPLPVGTAAETRDITTTGGSKMREVTVGVTYRFHGPIDHLDVNVPGEAMDSGDKATPKAMSVALRIALLQALLIPTKELAPDPDSQNYVRANEQATQPADPGRGNNGQRRTVQKVDPTVALQRLHTVIEEVRGLRDETVLQSNKRVADYCKERLRVDVITAREKGDITKLDLSRLDETQVQVLTGVIQRSVREIHKARLAQQQEV